MHAHSYISHQSINEMALAYNFLFFCLSLVFFISRSEAKTSFKPKALVVPVTKDSSTLQYLTQIQQRTPLVPVKLTLDLGGGFLWVNCEQGFVSSSYKPARCGSAQCKIAGSESCVESCLPKGPGCNNNTCTHFPGNTVSHVSTFGELATDVVSIQSTDGSKPGQVVPVPNIIFACGATFLLEGLASGFQGMAGLGRNKVSLPSQLSAAAFKLDRKFSICLSSNGAVFFGDVSFPGIDPKSLIYTRLIRNPVSSAGASFEGESSAEYFIGVKSILISGNVVPLNKSLLSINKEGFGGTKISTVFPYTVLETSIYKAFVKTFIKSYSNIPRVKPMAPFGACFNSSFIGSTHVGAAAPEIHLYMPGTNRMWKIFGANSMVRVGKHAMCLAFVDGGVNPTTSIVIGAYQLEDNLLQFDLAKSRLGFSSSLLARQTTCSNLISNVFKF